MQVRARFVVAATLNNQPLRNAIVAISNDEYPMKPKFTGLTQDDGTLPVHVPPGKYWIDVSFLGISAGSQRFQVSARSPLIAKSRMTYSWGDDALDVRAVQGTLKNSKMAAEGRNLVWRFTHPVEVPVEGAPIRLTRVVDGEQWATTSDEKGGFGFPPVHVGLYVLHVEKRNSNPDDEPEGHLIRVSEKALTTKIVLIRGGAICGGTVFAPDKESASDTAPTPASPSPSH